MEIAGSSDPGGYAPVLLPRTIRVRGEQALPAPRPITPARFSSGPGDGVRVDVRRVVKGFQSAEAVIFIEPGHIRDEVAEVARGETHE